MGVRGADRKAVERSPKEIAPLIFTGPPGVTGFAGGRPKVEETLPFGPALMPKSRDYSLMSRSSTLSMNGVPCGGVGCGYWFQVTGLKAQDVRRPKTKSMQIQLTKLAHARSGDKGDTATSV